jgi:pyruvate dehydrogenase complex dehydrogenase (E1) component
MEVAASLERRIRSVMRWSAVIMICRTKSFDPLGGKSLNTDRLRHEEPH